MSDTYSFEPHGPWRKRRGQPWEVCAGCSLIALGNAFTRWAIAKGCNHADHPDYARMRKESARG